MQRNIPLSFGLWAVVYLPVIAVAGTLSLATEPLGTSTGTKVKPNLMFILDDSLSMERAFMPEYVDDARCYGSSGLDSCQLGDPPYASSGYNKQYYNPQINYRPPLKQVSVSGGVETWENWPAASTSAPLRDPFSGSTSTQSLSAYPDYAWCSSWWSTPTGNPATDANCKYYTAGVAESYPKYSASSPTYNNKASYNSPVPYYYLMSAAPTWCKTWELTTCASRRSASYTYPKFSAQAAVTGVAAYQDYYVIKAGGTVAGWSGTINYVCYNDDNSNTNGCSGTNILTTPISMGGKDSKNNRNALADWIVANVGGGFVATKTQSDTSTTSSPCSTWNVSKCALIRITAPGGAASSTNTNNNGKYVNFETPTGFQLKNAVAKLDNGVDAMAATTGVTFTRVEIKSGQTYTKYSGRDDCAGTSCTYAEELQNFANWYSYYRTRMAMMKSSISHAFKDVSDSKPGAGFRVGLITLGGGSSVNTSCIYNNRAREIEISDFSVTNKNAFYTNLFGIVPCYNTPTRGALARAGQIFAGKGSYDPIQYSCQQNFSFLSTDGYWNTADENSAYGPHREDKTTDVGNCDAKTSSTDADSACFPNDRDDIIDRLNKSNTLADVALYYYKKDLRPSMTNDVPTSSDDPNREQHMVTFTMGLGVDGTLIYNKNYKTGGSVDYEAIKQATKEWPDPINNEAEERIDDLWHAAVNGHGKYFSASSPTDVADGLAEAFAAVSAKTGAAAAAATSNLEPVPGDNYAYVASYTTQTWDGNLEAKEIDLTTGALATTNTWSAQSKMDAQILETTPSGASGPGSRNLFTYDSSISGTDKKLALTWTNMTTKGWDGKFAVTLLDDCNPASNCTGATSQNLFEYLMGGVDATPNKSYRPRVHVLGDIVNTQPVYVGKPALGYTDSGYSDFKNVTRDSVVYVSANDGFLHALNASSGTEKWAFMPSPVLDTLYNLANTNYAHRYYVDGTLSAGDVYLSSGSGAWKTLLVGGLGAGGKYYFALDVTDPAAPKALWQFTDSTMGYAMGNPLITKLPEGATDSSGTDIAGKWVAILSSGYNNGAEGRIFVLDAYSGTEYFRIKACTNQAAAATCAASNNGIAKMNAWSENPSKDNTSTHVYAGDLDGDLWRFDLAEKKAFKVASTGEPITVKPELAEVSGKRGVFFGTGIFLQSADKSDSAKRTVYGIKDDLAATTTLTGLKSGTLVQQTMAVLATDSSKRYVSSNNPVDWTLKSGWYVNLLESGERVNVDPKIQLGTLVVASNVPDSTSANACTAGGHSWLNYFDIQTGGYVINEQSNSNQIISTMIGNALAVGTNVVKLPNGKLVTITTTSDNKHVSNETPVSSANLGSKRVLWRELISD